MTNSERQTDLLVVGSVAFDSIETPTGSVDKALGGSAVFASIAASYFGRPRVVAVVGDDFGADSYALLEGRGIDTRGIEKVAGGKTFHWKGRYHDNMKDRDTLDTCLHVFADFDPVLSPPLRRSSHVFLGNIGPRLQAQVLDQVEDPRFVGMDTMNLWISNALTDLKDVLRRVDVLFVNDDESHQLTGERQVLNAAREILELGPEYVVIKRGEHGALLFGNGLCRFVPAVPLSRVVDPTGAGDAFAGGFMGFIAGAGEITPPALTRAMRAGSVMASFACEAFSVGGLAASDPAEIERRVVFLESMSA